MNPLYTSLTETALRLIKDYGMVTTIKIPTPGAPVIPVEAWNPTANTFVTKDVNMVFLPEETINYYSQYFSLIEREPYQIGFEYALLGNENLKPALNMVVSRGGREQAIRYVSEYAPSGVAILYIVGLKE